MTHSDVEFHWSLSINWHKLATNNRARLQKNTCKDKVWIFVFVMMIAFIITLEEIM